MCRSIITLRTLEPAVTPEQIRAASLQYVRKVSGYRAPSKANTEAFDHAVEEIARATTLLLESIGAPIDHEHAVSV